MTFSDKEIVELTEIIRDKGVEAYRREVLSKIRTRWEKSERAVIDCNPKAVKSIPDIDVLLEQYKDFQFDKEYQVIKEDNEIIKRNFMKNCICRQR